MTRSERNLMAQGSEGNDLRALILSPTTEKELQKVLPRYLTPTRYTQILLTALLRSPKLFQAEPASFMEAAMRCAELGLEANGWHAHLIPFDDWRTKKTLVKLIVDYKGYADIILRDKSVSTIHADIICANDDFSYNKGQVERHSIDIKRDRGEAIGAYTIVFYKDGSEKSAMMAKEDILNIRDNSEGWKAFQAGKAKQSPWNPQFPTSEKEMWKKTTVRRVIKLMKMTNELQKLAVLDDEDYSYTYGAEVTSAVIQSPAAIPSGSSAATARSIPPAVTPQRQEEIEIIDQDDEMFGVDPAPDPGTVEGPKKDMGLIPLIVEGRKIIGEEAFGKLLQPINPNAQRMGDLTPDEQRKLMDAINKLVDEKNA